jgi:hypothetical protein
MEPLAILFFLGIMVYLNWPQKPPKKPDPDADFADAVKAYLKAGVSVRELQAKNKNGK